MRAVHEAQLWENNCFVTLTYSNENLPSDYGLHYEHFQAFMKKLRQKRGANIRMMTCGEYGDEYLRPHWHSILFNMDFSEKTLFKIDRGNKIYTSKLLTNLWPYGHSTLGDVTFESAAYVARYSLKKYSNSREPEKEKAHYTRVHPLTGEIHQVSSEIFQISRRPGLGAMWLDRFKSDVFPSDYVIVRGLKVRPPKFYDQQLTEEELEKIKQSRLDLNRDRRRSHCLYRPGMGRLGDYEQTPERRRVREFIQTERVKQLKRSLPED